MKESAALNNSISIKNYKTLKHLCLWASNLGVIQSCIWIALTIVGILSYNCLIYPTDNLSYGSLVSIIFIDLYFKGDCQPTNFPGYNSTLLRQVQTILQPDNIFIWDCVYMVVALCWLIVSLMTFFNLQSKNIKSFLIIVLLWIICTMIISVMDFVLGIIFAIDYTRFQQEASHWNYSPLNAGIIDANAAQLLGGQVVSISMVILMFKGFVLWLINVALIIALSLQLINIAREKGGMSKLFTENIESNTNPYANQLPIDAYQEELKADFVATTFNNEGFESDANTVNNCNENQAKAIELNERLLARAARISTDVAILERCFRNLDTYQQYPHKSMLESSTNETTSKQSVVHPAPDYSPQLTKTNHNYSEKH